MLLLPRNVGPFTLLQHLGTGGVAESYLGKVAGEGDRTVVLRRLQPFVRDSADRVRATEQRVRDLTHLQHPFLVRVMDWVEDGEERFVVEAHVEGIDLAHLLEWCRAREQSIPHNVLLNLATQLCNGLEAVHGRPGQASGSPHVLHLGVRPAAVKITREGKVVLGGFGLVRTPLALPAASLAAVGPERVRYIAPEQCTPGTPLTPATDIFSLGALLYELITLQPLFPGRSLQEVQQQLREGELADALQMLRARLPGIDRVLQRCLSRNPRYRYHRAFVLREDLRALMAGYSFNTIVDDTRRFLQPVLGRDPADWTQEASPVRPPPAVPPAAPLPQAALLPAGLVGIGAPPEPLLGPDLGPAPSEAATESPSEAQTVAVGEPLPVLPPPTAASLPPDPGFPPPPPVLGPDGESVELSELDEFPLPPPPPAEGPPPAALPPVPPAAAPGDEEETLAVPDGGDLPSGMGLPSGIGAAPSLEELFGAPPSPRLDGRRLADALRHEQEEEDELARASGLTQTLAAPPPAADAPPARSNDAQDDDEGDVPVSTGVFLRPTADTARLQAVAALPPPLSEVPPPPTSPAPPPSTPGPSESLAPPPPLGALPPPPAPVDLGASIPSAPLPPPPPAAEELLPHDHSGEEPPTIPAVPHLAATAPPPVRPAAHEDVTGGTAAPEHEPSPSRWRMGTAIGVAALVFLFVGSYAGGLLLAEVVGEDAAATADPEPEAVAAVVVSAPPPAPEAAAVAEVPEAAPSDNVDALAEDEPEPEPEPEPLPEPDRPTRSAPPPRVPSSSPRGERGYEEMGTRRSAPPAPSTARSSRPAPLPPEPPPVADAGPLPPPPPGLPGSEVDEAPPETRSLDDQASRARTGALDAVDVQQLEARDQLDPEFSRARTILLIDAHARQDEQAAGRYLADLLRVPENRYNPSLLAEMARHQVNQRRYGEALGTANKAEQHWARLPSAQVFAKQAEIYEVQAAATQGLLYLSEDEAEQRQLLDSAIGRWRRLAEHGDRGGRTDISARAMAQIDKLEDIQRRIQ